MPRPIFITSSPNTEADDLRLAVKTLLAPWNWQTAKWSEQLQAQLTSYWGLGSFEQVMLFDSGRAALYFALKELGIGRDDEVILPAFTCLAVANPVHWIGATPIYVDVNRDTFNIDIELIKSKLSPQTKAIVVQHTFGKPVDVKAVRSIVGPNVMIIEDCAHSLGSNTGREGDLAILGFGIDKVISGVRGGALIINNIKLVDQINYANYSKLKNPNSRLTWTSLLNPIIWSFSTPTYFWGWKSFTLGRLLIRVLYKLGLMGNVVDPAENVGVKPVDLPTKMSNPLARLVLNQLDKLNKHNNHRLNLAKLYSEGLKIKISEDQQVFQKFSFLLPDSVNRQKLIQDLRDQQHIIIGDWLPRPLYSKWSSTDVYKVLKYKPIDFPVAEEIGRRIVNLPTSIRVTEKDARRLIQAIVKLTV